MVKVVSIEKRLEWYKSELDQLRREAEKPDEFSDVSQRIQFNNFLLNYLKKKGIDEYFDDEHNDNFIKKLKKDDVANIDIRFWLAFLSFLITLINFLIQRIQELKHFKYIPRWKSWKSKDYGYHISRRRRPEWNLYDNLQKYLKRGKKK